MKRLATIRRLLRRGALPLAAATLLAACGDNGFSIVVPGGSTGGLRSGVYDYDAWTYGRRTAYWGFVDLRVGVDGALSGTYRLPAQCTDGYGYEADCVGYVGGRVYSDGEVRFGFDEGWLRHDGEANRWSEVAGRWETRILGARSEGSFELLPR